jgi:hypothetical protein
MWCQKIVPYLLGGGYTLVLGALEVTFSYIGHLRRASCLS